MDRDDTNIFRSYFDHDAEHFVPIEPGIYESTAIIPAALLAPRNYEIAIRAGIYNQRLCIPEPGLRLPLTVRATSAVDRASAGDQVYGLLQPAIRWTTRTVRE